METKENFIKAMLDAIIAIDDSEERGKRRLSTLPPPAMTQDDWETIIE